MSTETARVCQAAGQYRPHRIRVLWSKFKQALFLRIWCRHLYRPVTRLMHRFNLHYAPRSPMDAQYGEQHHWCQWCGLRGTTYIHDPKNSLNL